MNAYCTSGSSPSPLKRVLATLTLLLTLLFVACGGGKNSIGNSSAPPIDPSGNWTLTATDANGNVAGLSALLAQTGSTVTSNSFGVFNTAPSFACVPFTATLLNGTVQNVSAFSGQIEIKNSQTGSVYGTMSFAGPLTPDGSSFSGTYSNMPACAGIGTSGTFAGREVPSTSGTWSGTIQPCSYDQTTGVCTLTGVSSTLSAVLTQDDSTGDVTGSYSVTNLAGFSSGNVAVVPTDEDVLSGLTWQFTMSDANGGKFIVNGQLGYDRTFKGLVFDKTSGNYFELLMSH